MCIHEERIQFSRALHLSVNGEGQCVYTQINGVARIRKNIRKQGARIKLALCMLMNRSASVKARVRTFTQKFAHLLCQIRV